MKKPFLQNILLPTRQLLQFSIFFFILSLILVFQSNLHASNTMNDVALAKARVWLTANLKARGYPNLAKNIDSINIEALAKTAGRLSGDSPSLEAEAIFWELLEEKEEALYLDFITKVKKNLVEQKVFGGRTLQYIDFVEMYSEDLVTMLKKTQEGNFRGASEILISRMKEELKIKSKKIVSGFVADTLNYFSKAHFGNLNIGAIYLKIIEMEMIAIEEFEDYTTQYFGTFHVKNNNGEKISYDWCSLYSKIRELGNNPYDSFYRQYDETGIALALDDLWLNGGIKRGGLSGGNWYSTSMMVEGEKRPDRDTFWKKLELCYIATNIVKKKADLDSKIEEARLFADEQLFKEIKNEIEKEKIDLINIFDELGKKFPTIVEVHFKVIDEKDGKPLKDVTVSWDGNVDKTNKDGYIFSKYTSDLLDSKKVWKIQLYKKGYEGTFYPRRVNKIISRYSVNANTAVLEFAMQPLEKLKFTVHIFDYETGGYLKNVIVSTSSKKQQITEDGIVNFKYTYYELVQSLASNIKDLVMKATALGYQAAELNIQIDSLIKNAENNHENILFIYLKRKKITKKSLDLIVELINSDNGNKITTLGSVKPDHQKEQSTKNGRASFSFKLSDLKNHALLGVTKIAIKGMASGYKQKDSVTVSANKLLDILDANKTSLTIKIPMIADSQGDFDRFEVHCDKPEIFEDQVSVCKAVIFNKIGKGLDVSKQVNWLPIYVDQIKGKVEGQTVARIEKLPYTLPIKAIFTTPSKHGGKQWPASNSVLIKARGNITKAVISISKSVNVYNISRGDSVTYNYHVRNPGNVSLSKIKIRDDKCSLIKYDSGDNNKDNILDQNETWLFDCSMTLDKNTTNTATVSGEYASGTTVSDTATATVTVHPSGLCPPPKVRVPGVVGQSVTGAKTKLTKIDLRGVIVQMQYIETIDINRVISQSPLKNECVDKHSKVNLWVSRGPEIITEPDKEMFSAVLLPDCIGSFEIVAGAGTSKSCGIRVRGWNQSDERVEVTVSYPSSSELIVFPGDTSASPHNMYNPGIADDKDKYIFSELFRAQDNAPIGITPVTITVSQKGVGSVTLRTNVSVLPKGSSVSSGCGVRPPAIVSRGSGGDYCVWRFKRFNSNPACFSFHMGKCDDSQFYYPKYELMGENMTNGEAWKRHRELGVEDDSYSCSPPDCDDDIDGDGTEDDQDGCPDDPKKQDPGKCGCNQSDRDLDKDGIPDCLDNCTSGIDLNTDGDSLADCEDGCPNNPDLIKPDEICNSCWPDDADEDGVLDCNDECPNDKNKTDAKHCGCNKLETDTDGDLWPDCIDECPNNSELTAFPNDIEAFLKTIDAGIQPARKALRDCEGMFIFTNLKNLKEKLARKQCKGALGISMRLKEVELLEKTIDPKNCSGEEKKECDIAPTTTFPQAARQCEVRQRIWGYGHGCFSEEKIAALKAEDGTTINCTTECNYCPKGYKKAVYNGYEGCVKCPKGKHFSNGCCR